MLVFQDGYLTRLLLAMLVVVIVPILFAKLSPFFRGFLKDEKKDLNFLIRKELLKLGKYFENQERKEAQKTSRRNAIDHNYVSSIYRKLAESVPETSSKFKDIISSLELFESIERNQSSHLTEIEKAIQNLVKIKLPRREIINSTNALLREKAFLTFDNQPYSFREVKNIITSRVLIQAFVRDAQTQISSVSKFIESSRRVDSKDLYVAIALLVMKNMGGSEKKLYEQASYNPQQILKRLKLMEQNNLKRAYMKICFNGDKAIEAKTVVALIKAEVKSLEQVRAKYQKKKQSEQNQKKQKQQNKQQKRFSSQSRSSNVSSLDSAYEILGCSKGDSTNIIKKSYRKLAMKHHPDREDGNQEKFVEIQNAYDAVKASRKKAA